MIFAYLSALQIRPLRRHHEEWRSAVSSSMALTSRRGDASDAFWLRVTDNLDAHLALIRISGGPLENSASAHITLVKHPEQLVTLFACIKAIYRYAADHNIEQIIITAPRDLAGAFPALALEPIRKAKPYTYMMRLGELKRRFQKSPHHPLLVYLITMPHHNIAYR